MKSSVTARDQITQTTKARLRTRFRAQHGVLSRSQAHSDGVTDRQIRHFIDTDEWERVLRNVFRHAAMPRSVEQRILAACLAAGPQAVASHESAAWLWKLLDRAPDMATVTLPASANCTVRGINVYRSSDLDLLRVRMHRGIPCTDPLRTIVDLAGRCDPATLDDVIDRALAKRLVRVRELVEEAARLAKPGRPGVRSLRAALRRRGMVGAPNPSVLESRTARAFLAHRVPLPKAEVTVGPEGEYRLDYALPDAMIALEVDGYVWHFSPEHKRRDEARRRDLVLAGWRPLVYTWTDVTRAPDRMVREYLAARATAPAARATAPAAAATPTRR
jgi:hypothetical protein